MIKLAPSILSADFCNIEKVVKQMEQAGAHYIHIDVMDGNFVSNITFGMPIIESIKKITNMTLDVHLMIDRPNRYIQQFAYSGADIITIHVESCDCVEETLTYIRELCKIPAIALKPTTKIEEVYKYLHLVDMVLVMTVEPGFAGQTLINHTLNKVQNLYDYAINNNLLIDIQVDGGINIDNVRNVILAGANVIVAGSSVFENDSIENNITNFYNLFEQAVDR